MNQDRYAHALHALRRATWLPIFEPAVVIGKDEQTPEQALDALKDLAREVTMEVLKGRLSYPVYQNHSSPSAS